ncbi:MAG: hypothetical protein U0T56_02755 [Ferruginibacter sp.]
MILLSETCLFSTWAPSNIPLLILNNAALKVLGTINELEEVSRF